MREKREFKVHDRVVADRAGYGVKSIGTVIRLTKTQVIAQFPGVKGESRYRRDNGYEVGAGRKVWGASFLRHATDQDYQDIAWSNLKSLAGRLDKIAEEYGRKDAALQLQIMADKFIAHINETEDQK